MFFIFGPQNVAMSWIWIKWFKKFNEIWSIAESANNGKIDEYVNKKIMEFVNKK